MSTDRREFLRKLIAGVGAALVAANIGLRSDPRVELTKRFEIDGKAVTLLPSERFEIDGKAVTLLPSEGPKFVPASDYKISFRSYKISFRMEHVTFWPEAPRIVAYDAVEYEAAPWWKRLFRRRPRVRSSYSWSKIRRSILG